ncbi:unnamed protein product [Blepharisma stoltei]|uniref:KAP NTPase domain-containing protein n=1 Tax=Blepharisma stoltei TaxID=1481888 RepID=A0AAU9JTL4_9CILI|nr:unnamed protein product [Blepharisma stoltei]
MEQGQEIIKEQEIEEKQENDKKNKRNSGNQTKFILLCLIGLQALSVYFIFTSSDFENKLVWYAIAFVILTCANAFHTYFNTSKFTIIIFAAIFTFEVASFEFVKIPYQATHLAYAFSSNKPFSSKYPPCIEVVQEYQILEKKILDSNYPVIIDGIHGIGKSTFLKWFATKYDYVFYFEIKEDNLNFSQSFIRDVYSRNEWNPFYVYMKLIFNFKPSNFEELQELFAWG